MARRAAKRARAAVATYALLIAATSCGGDPRPPAEDVARTPAAEAEHITIKVPRQGASVRATGGLAGPRRAQLSLRGTANDGTPLKYDGVSILEIDGGQIKRFCAYFDAGALGRQLTGKAHGQNG